MLQEKNSLQKLASHQQATVLKNVKKVVKVVVLVMMDCQYFLWVLLLLVQETIKISNFSRE
jgi:hypothetical protein